MLRVFGRLRWVVLVCDDLGRLAAGLALLAVIGGCAPAGVGGAARGVVPAVKTQQELTGALLKVEDLPTGYTVAPGAAAQAPSGAAAGSGGGADPCADVFGQLRGSDPVFARVAAASARVEFTKGDYGPFLQEVLLSTGDRAAVDAAIEEFRQLPKVCDGFTETDEQGSFSVKLSETELPTFGRESVSLKLDANGRSIDLDVTLSGYMILIRHESTVCVLIHFGIPGVDVGETEKIARAAAGRLG